MTSTTNTADHRSLYEVTGDIKDINTMLVPRAALATPAQAAAPDMTDAYAGAREDLSIWKKRALEAEALNRKFAASVNSPSFMGEPPAQAASIEQEAMQMLWNDQQQEEKEYYRNVAYWRRKDQMTNTNTLTPVDADIIALADKTRTGEPGREGYILPISFARAVLAKWGSPAPARHPVAAPAQAGEYPPPVCDYCGALTPDPWHSSGMLHGKMSKHIHSCDVCAACAAQGAAQVQAMLAAVPIAPAREPLTDEQIDEIHLANSDDYERGDVEYESHGFARAIEQAHGIKDTNPESNK